MDRLEARGQNGTVTFDGAVVTLARWRRPERQLAVGGIADVELRPAGALVSGFIEFRAPDARRAGGAGENAVVFGRRQEAQFAALRDAVQVAMGRPGLPYDGIARPDQPREAIAGHKAAERFEWPHEAITGSQAATDSERPREAVAGHEAVGSGGSVADELTKLAHLVELELLTREEFDAQKAKLLKG